VIRAAGQRAHRSVDVANLGAHAHVEPLLAALTASSRNVQSSAPSKSVVLLHALVALVGVNDREQRAEIQIIVRVVWRVNADARGVANDLVQCARANCARYSRTSWAMNSKSSRQIPADR